MNPSPNPHDPDRSRRRTILAVTVALVCLMVVGLLYLATSGGTSSAIRPGHTPTIAARCDGLHVDLNAYQPHGNVVTITVDGNVQRHPFGSEYHETIAWDPAHTHVWVVNVRASDAGFDHDEQGVQRPCTTDSTAPATSATSTTRPPRGSTTTTTRPQPTTTTTTVPAATTTTTTPAVTTTTVAPPAATTTTAPPVATTAPPATTTPPTAPPAPPVAPPVTTAPPAPPPGDSLPETR